MSSKLVVGVAMALLVAVCGEVALARRPALAPVRGNRGARARPLSRPARKPAPLARAASVVLVFPGSGVLVPNGYSMVWPGLLAGKVVVLDPGHGGSASGAVAPQGLRESDLNLYVARELKEFLAAAGATVVLTRVGDTDCLARQPFVLRDDLVARAQMSNHLAADLFLSCHHNDAPVALNQAALARYNRTEIYYRMDDDGPSRALGDSLFSSLWPLLSNRRSQLIPGAFAVLRFNERPAVLGEPFYISAASCEKTARHPQFAAAEATRYLAGMLAYLRGSYDPPRVLRPIEGEVVDRETFPVAITVPPLRTEPAAPTVSVSPTSPASSTTSVPPTLVVTIAGRPATMFHDRTTGRAWTRLAGVPNGRVLLEATLIGPSGRTAPVTRRHFMFEMPPASIQASLAPAEVDRRYRGPTVLTALVRDARGLPIADGTPVRIAQQGRVLASPRSIAGRIQLTLDPAPPAPVTTAPAWFTGTSGPTMTLPAPRGFTSAATAAAPLPPLVPAGPLTLSVLAGLISTTVASVPTSSPSPTCWLACRAFDARTGQPIGQLAARSLAAPGSVPAALALDRSTGNLVVHAGAAAGTALDLEADGYMPRTVTGLELTPAGSRLDLAVTPVLSGALHQRSVVFDADSGSQTAAFLKSATEVFAGTGVDGAWATWNGSGELDEQARARVANRTPAELVITVMNHVPGRLAGPVEVHHYHASDRGKALAISIAEAFKRYHPAVTATRRSGGSYFLNNTRATTIGLSFGNGRRSTPLPHDRVAYIVMHGLMRALRPDLARGRTIAGRAPAGVMPGMWMILGNGDRLRLDPAGQYTFLDVPPGRHPVWFQTETPDHRPRDRATFWIDVP